MSRLTRVERQARTREELLAAAARVFARSGYRAASVAEIADEAGYSHGAVYSNFAGKEDLFLALYEEWVAERTGAIAATWDTDRTLEDHAREGTREWLEHVEEHPE